MGHIYEGTLGLIGNTPLVELTHIEKKFGLNQDYLQSWSTLIRLDLLRTVSQKK